MKTEASPSTTRTLIREAQRGGAIVGVVPTMGALHRGHVSLIEIARQQCDYVVATIFVNPTQFGPNEDFDKYPRTLEDDLAACEAAGADLVFVPQTSEMYEDDAETEVCVSELTRVLEGSMRPGHFDGVTTVVAKLFNITVPDKAYFGQKDYQQQLVIRRMVRDLNFGVEIVTCPIIREDDGLAMSSRNRYLSADAREKALSLSRALTVAKESAASGETPADAESAMLEFLKQQSGVELDYAVIADTDTLQPVGENASAAVALVAARVGETRLIDNEILRFRSTEEIG